jgi:hypothetical protein
VRVSFGEPIALAPYAAGYRRDPAGAVNALTEAIQLRMEALVVHVERLDRDALARTVERIFGDELAEGLERERGLPADRVDPVRLSRSIVDAVAYFETREPERSARLRERLDAYEGLLAAWRVQDEAVRTRMRGGRGLGPRLRYGGQASLGLPLFAYGAAVNALPYLVPRWLARRLARRETDYATTRLLASVVSVPLFWGAETWVVWRLAGPAWATGFLLSLPLSGLVAHRYLRGLGQARGRLRLRLLELVRRPAATRLAAEREALVAELHRAKSDYLAATRGATF